MKGLLVCPTPIGNLGDISERQLDALRTADVLLCEDTRTTGKLLEHLGIKRRDGIPALWSYHEHNEAERIPAILELLTSEKLVVLVSDAGTPTISDPGFRIVAEARKQGYEVSALPGPIAAFVALSASGLPTDRILFEGFLSPKSGERKKRLEQAKLSGATLALYESPKRIRALLNDINTVYGDTEIVIGRELTKKFETYYSGTSKNITKILPENIKGECVVLIAPFSKKTDYSRARELVESLVISKVNPKEIRKIVRLHYGVSKKEIFDWLEAIKNTDANL